MSLLNCFRVSGPAMTRVSEEEVDRVYRRCRLQTILGGTVGYAIYYICRLSLGVMKQPLIDAGLLSATQLGLIGACMYWAYAFSKVINGFLADHSNIRRFMATGLLISVVVNILMGVLGIAAQTGALSNGILFLLFAILWTVNGSAQSMGTPPVTVALSRWFSRDTRGTYLGLVYSSHSIGESISFILMGWLVVLLGWIWGFLSAGLIGLLGIVVILLFLHDTPESEGLPPLEKDSEVEDTLTLQKNAVKAPLIWVIAVSSAFLYICRYAINEWGVIFLQETKGYDLSTAAMVVGISPVLGILGSVTSGWLSDKIFSGDRRVPLLISGLLLIAGLGLFLIGGPAMWLNILAMVLFGMAIGLMVCYTGGIMIIDIVDSRSTGAAIGLVSTISYIAAGLQNIITGRLMDLGGGTHDYSVVTWMWIGSAFIAFLLPVLVWKKPEIR